MTVLTLLAGLALAGAPVAIPVAGDAAPDGKELEKHLQEVLGVSNLKLEAADAIEYSKALATGLLAHPGECVATVGDKPLGALGTIAEKADEVYVVYNANDKAKSAAVWRYGAKKKQLTRVTKDGVKVLPPANAPAKLILLTSKDERNVPEAIEAQREWLGAEAVEVVDTDGTLVDALRAAPGECAAELAEGVADRLDALAEGVEGDLMIAVHDAKAEASHFWRWDTKAKALLRVATK